MDLLDLSPEMELEMWDETADQYIAVESVESMIESLNTQPPRTQRRGMYFQIEDVRVLVQVQFGVTTFAKGEPPQKALIVQQIEVKPDRRRHGLCERFLRTLRESVSQINATPAPSVLHIQCVNSEKLQACLIKMGARRHPFGETCFYY
jgi:hypothetical protein